MPGTAIKIEAVPSLRAHTHCRGLTSAAGEGGDATKADGPEAAARAESRAGAPAASSLLLGRQLPGGGGAGKGAEGGAEPGRSRAARCQGHPGAGASEPPRSWPGRWLASCLPPWREILGPSRNIHKHGSCRGFGASVTQTLAAKPRLPLAPRGQVEHPWVAPWLCTHCKLNPRSQTPQPFKFTALGSPRLQSCFSAPH